jgi:hypothetical protein
MSNTTQQRKNEWEKRHVQSVLDFYNCKYDTHFVVLGKSTDIYPELIKQSNRHLDWDWVCTDPQTGNEFAVEVKRITDQKAEEKSHILWQLLTEVQNNLNNNRVLQGTFHLSSNFSMSFDLPFSKNNKNELKEVLYNIILEESQKLEVGKEIGLTSKVQRQLSFRLPELTLFILHKIDAQNSYLSKGSGIGTVGSINFDEEELEEFQRLLIHANMQLGTANPRNTLLVIIEEGFRHKDPDTITDAFSRISPEYYLNIDQVYFISGKEVAEIQLPNSR